MDYNRLWASIQESYKVWPVSFTPQIKLLIRKETMNTPVFTDWNKNPKNWGASHHGAT